VCYYFLSELWNTGRMLSPNTLRCYMSGLKMELKKVDKKFYEHFLSDEVSLRVEAMHKRYEADYLPFLELKLKNNKISEVISTMGQLCTERSTESNNRLVKSQKFDCFLLSSNRSVHTSPIVANIFILKSTFPVLMRVHTSFFD
jgi:hypothetical protein